MNTKQTKLTVDGMSCPSCMEHVRDALAIAGVQQVDVRIREGSVVVDHDANLAIGKLISALEASGYEARAA